MALIYSLHSEILKLLYRRATHVVLFLILVFQTFLANIGAFQIVSVPALKLSVLMKNRLKQ